VEKRGEKGRKGGYKEDGECAVWEQCLIVRERISSILVYLLLCICSPNILSLIHFSSIPPSPLVLSPHSSSRPLPPHCSLYLLSFSYPHPSFLRLLSLRILPIFSPSLILPTPFRPSFSPPSPPSSSLFPLSSLPSYQPCVRIYKR
jgi:hypothetical protein